jgi:prefoldin alpha subunit
MDEKEMQSKYLEFQMLDQQIKQIQKHLQTLEGQIDEIMAIKDALDDVQDVKEGTEILVPVSNGIFVKAIVKDTKRLQVNVGFNVNVEKSVEETQQLMNEQLKEIHQQHDTISVQLQESMMKAGALEKELIDMTENV